MHYYVHKNNNDPAEFKRTIEAVFPRLGGRVLLDVLIIPANGFTSAYLADGSNLGQVYIYYIN